MLHRRTFRGRVLLAVVLGLGSVSLAADRATVKEVAQQLMCPCGCNQTLGNCNHVNCPNMAGMTKEVVQQLDEGKSKDAILDAFSEKYGMAILSSPPAQGFNLAAWLAPFVALAIGISMVVYFVRTFKSRWPQAAAATEKVDMAKYEQRVEDELKKFTPED
jgi:cytochrome c-type biogenesis protein CcmH